MYSIHILTLLAVLPPPFDTVPRNQVTTAGHRPAWPLQLSVLKTVSFLCLCPLCPRSQPYITQWHPHTLQATSSSTKHSVPRSIPCDKLLMLQASNPCSAFFQILASPAVRAAARAEGLDLGTVVGTGPQGRITQQDLLR